MSEIDKSRPKKPKTGGRAKGTPNKATAEARTAIASFVDGNAHRLQEWLDAVALENPEKAFVLLQSLIEYHVPKLARREIVGESGGPIQLVLSGSDIHG